MFSLKWQSANHTSRAQSSTSPGFLLPLSLPVWINLSVGIHQKQLPPSLHQQATSLFPTSATAGRFSVTDGIGGKRRSSLAQVNPFQLNLNNQSVRELSIQAGQKAKVLLLSVLQDHLSWDVTASRGVPTSTPTPSKPLSNNTTPTHTHPLLPTLSLSSSLPNSSTAGLSHQLYGGECLDAN